MSAFCASPGVHPGRDAQVEPGPGGGLDRRRRPDHGRIPRRRRPRRRPARATPPRPTAGSSTPTSPRSSTLSARCIRTPRTASTRCRSSPPRATSTGRIEGLDLRRAPRRGHAARGIVQPPGPRRAPRGLAMVDRHGRVRSPDLSPAAVALPDRAARGRRRPGVPGPGGRAGRDARRPSDRRGHRGRGPDRLARQPTHGRHVRPRVAHDPGDPARARPAAHGAAGRHRRADAGRRDPDGPAAARADGGVPRAVRAGFPLRVAPYPADRPPLWLRDLDVGAALVWLAESRTAYVRFTWSQGTTVAGRRGAARARRGRASGTGCGRPAQPPRRRNTTQPSRRCATCCAPTRSTGRRLYAPHRPAPTFSARRNFATELERDISAAFVCEPTGGSPNLYADTIPVEVPSLGVAVKISTPYRQKSTPGDPAAGGDRARPAGAA